MKTTLAHAALAAALVCCGSAALAATPPPGFEDHVLVPESPAGVTTPVGIAYEPGSGALFIVEKGDGTRWGTARVRRRDPVTGAVTTALSLTCVDSEGERGLLGIDFDTDYLAPGNATRFVYIFYTRGVDVTGPCVIQGLVKGGYNSIVRYQESGGVLTNPVLLLRGPVLEANNHQGGTVRSAPDGTIYVSMGDNDTDAYPVPASRNLNDLRGKMLRLNRDGSIPADNPFVGQAGVRPEIWAWGLRNPFRFSMDAHTGNAYIGDVGEANWEEIDVGIAGADYGWPCLEASQTFRNCSPPPSGDVKPIYAYGHNGQTGAIEGDSVISGPVYHGGSFPVEYDHQYFFGDYGANWIRRAGFTATGMLKDITMFMPDATSVTDLAVSPAGCLTWVSIGGLGIHDVCYAGGSNAQPQARSSAAPTSGLAPLPVQFDASLSTDDDQDPLTYSWNLGDGVTSTLAMPQRTYASNGVRDVTLTVNDGTGATNATDAAPPIRIVVGNRAPTGQITVPAPGTTYSAGDTIVYAGAGTDPDDGTLPASAFAWTIVFHHADHTHPFAGPITGARSGTFTIPTDGEEATDVFYRISLTATDSGAALGAAGKLTHDSFVDITPNVATFGVAANPPSAGLQLEIDHVPGIAPWSIQTVAGYLRTLTAPAVQVAGGATWNFVSWSDGGAAEHMVAPPAVNTTYTATYQCVANCGSVPALSASRIAPDTARLQWSAMSCASSYDLVRGRIGLLKSTGGNFTTATVACVANNLAVTTADDATATPGGGGYWYLVRANGCPSTTYDEAAGNRQAGARDAEIAASPNACP
jgi:glucose/arabinose dehydrogenase/PKD repeat protein